MITIITGFIALVSTSAFIALWFWVARRELSEKQKTVDAAKQQFTASRQQIIRVRDGPEETKAREIMERSQSILRQAVERYNDTLQRPWNAVPALFWGFRRIPKNGEP